MLFGNSFPCLQALLSQKSATEPKGLSIKTCGLGQEQGSLGGVRKREWLRARRLLSRVSAVFCEGGGFLSMVTMTAHTGLSRGNGRRALARVTHPSKAIVQPPHCRDAASVWYLQEGVCGGRQSKDWGG